MRVHEFQARQLLAEAGVPVPAGGVATTVEEAVQAAQSVFASGGAITVVKAQVHAGGRGKAGFVKVCKSVDEARTAANFMLSNRMVSLQTPPEGLEVRRLLVASGVDIAKEFYVAVLTDRSTRRNVLIASAEGGVDIEHVAATRPDAILKRPLDPVTGLHPHMARDIAFRLGFKGKTVGQAADIFLKLARTFIEKDATLAEINPLVLTPATAAHPDGQVVAIDAKFTFDDNALFRQKQVHAFFDPAEENASEIRANEFGLSYVALDGTIGCLVNGAGLAMSTMDIVKLHGGEPANFLDVGGSASEEAVTEAFRIILSDTRVKGVLVNIFGGIMQCDRIARAIIASAKAVGFQVPLVVRLEGTNVKEARTLLEAARGDIPTMQTAGDLTDAAMRIVAAVKG
ncbi:MAG: ADP-forming succinate--CoA ligase subunit beta [Planctomycetes bacterium]|nr:ADP-forming succinate--CoA ligase subunit beta [Planctomycetota bacterium]